MSAEFEIPQHSGETLCVPPASELASLAQRNMAALERAPVALAGVSLAQVRRQARQEVAEAASSYARTLGIAASTPHVGDPLIVTGHQPSFFHPGIWLKHLLVNRIASDHGWVGLSMPVDLGVEDLTADAPRRDGTGLHLVRETLLRVGPDAPYETFGPPSEGDWDAFVHRLLEHLQTIPLPEAINAVQAFARAAGPPTGAPDLVSFLTAVRRRYEGRRSYAELPVSRISATGAFKQFAWHLLRDAERLAAIYNRHLANYRMRHNIRTVAQPFPDLARNGDAQETPFWVLHNRRRVPLFVRRSRRAVELFAATSPVLAVDEDAGPDALRTLAVRPRALTLTLFTRLCLADVMVHGVGGGRYDRVTDEVMREYFGIAPPGYAVATATLHLPLQTFDPAAERQALQRRLLEIQHNPDRMITHPTPAQHTLITAKRALIAALEGGGLTRRDRREETHRIREINERLAQTLAGELQAVKSELTSLEGGQNATTAATHRGYPFFMFSPSDVDALVEQMLRARR